LEFDTVPLSHRAASGFFDRTSRSGLTFAPEFLEGVLSHIDAVSRELPVPA
jgi:hypothetical protein